MNRKCYGRPGWVVVALVSALLLPVGGCVPDQEQLAEFLRDLFLSALAAFLL